MLNDHLAFFFSRDEKQNLFSIIDYSDGECHQNQSVLHHSNEHFSSIERNNFRLQINEKNVEFTWNSEMIESNEFNVRFSSLLRVRWSSISFEWTSKFYKKNSNLFSDDFEPKDLEL